jgi:RNA polymerase sigma-70 factor (ECF subfamily)
MWVGHSCPTPLTLLLTLEHGELANYYLAHSARADMYRRLGRAAEARASYEKALALTQQEPERQFLQERIRQLK